MDMRELIEQGLSFVLLTEEHPEQIGFLTELIDAYRGDPMPNPKYDMANGRVMETLSYPVILWNKSYIPSPAISFLHKNWWKEQGKWEKGQPKTEWYKQPIPVRIVQDYNPNFGYKLLHTLKDETGAVWYVMETTPSTRPAYWLVYG